MLSQAYHLRSMQLLQTKRTYPFHHKSIYISRYRRPNVFHKQLLNRYCLFVFASPSVLSVYSSCSFSPILSAYSVFILFPLLLQAHSKILHISMIIGNVLLFFIITPQISAFRMSNESPFYCTKIQIFCQNIFIFFL